jgi:hypothetical protein
LCENFFGSRQVPRDACIACGRVDGEDLRHEVCSNYIFRVKYADVPLNQNLES